MQAIESVISWLKHRRIHCDRTLVLSLIGGFLVGACISWWLNLPVPPWIEFHEISASYELGSNVVKVSGTYTATRTCSRDEQNIPANAPEPLVWRQEVRGTGPEIAQYAPSPASPTLKIGTHTFATDLPLSEGIKPDGWQIAIIVSCDTEPYAVRSRSVPVVYVSEFSLPE